MIHFNLQAALEALERAADEVAIHSRYHASDYAILRDLRERLAGAQEAWQYENGLVQSGIVGLENAAGYRPVLIIPIDAPRKVKFDPNSDGRGGI